VYGINTNVPTVLFYDERQALANFSGGLGFWGKCYLESLRVQFDCDVNEIWLDPKKGVLCRGPAGPDCKIPGEDLELLGLVLPCSAELLQGDNCLRFLASSKPKDIDRWFMQVIAWSGGRGSRGLSEVEVNRPTIISKSTNAKIAVSGGIWVDLERCLGDREVIENGLTRFTLKDEGDELTLYIDMAKEREIWMSQASSVFHERGISLDGDLSQYVPNLALSGELSISETTCRRRREKPIYLLVHPLSTSTPMEECTTSRFHYWSFDPSGHPPLSAEVCEDLGLPVELDLRVFPHKQYRWNNDHYKRMHEYQLSRGFDRRSPDFARHLGYPIYQAESDSDRFEDVDGYTRPNTQLSCLQQSISTPFASQLPYSDAAIVPSNPFYSHISSGEFSGSTYPNDYPSRSGSLPSPGSRVLPASPISMLGLPPSPANLSPYEELRGWKANDTSSLKRKNRDTPDLDNFPANGKRARLLEISESDVIPPQEAECGASSERLEGEGVDSVRGKPTYVVDREMDGPAVQTKQLKDKNRRLREEIERLTEMLENRRLREKLERLKEELGITGLGLDSVG
ncbi:hypothetical protein V5O48_013092, partial [Marasmius crinis-equi]